MDDHGPLINECAILLFETPFPLLKKQFKIKFLIRDAPLGVTLEFRFRWHRTPGRVFTSTGADMKSFPKLSNFDPRKNGSNDFLQTWYQPSLGRGLPFDTLGHPVKISLWPLGGPQKCELLNRLSDFDEIFFKRSKNSKLKKLSKKNDPRSHRGSPMTS